VPLPLFTTVPFAEDREALLRSLPRRPGVCAFLGEGGVTLLVGRPANLQRWVASRIGAGRPVRPGSRPPLDLSPIAKALSHATTRSPFEQRLVFERLLGGSVPRAARKDLRNPAFLRLDLGERFPRLRVLSGGAAGESLYGPFRTRASAELALREMHKLFPLRPCDYSFEPSEDLELGLGCLYAQTRTCSAPCLCRISEAGYQDLAREASVFLADPSRRPDSFAPPWVGRSGGSRGLVVVPGAEISLYPVREATVLEDESVRVGREGLADALAALGWEAPPHPPDDAAWLTEWLYSRKRGAAYLVLGARDDGGSLLGAVNSALDVSGGGSPPTKRW
jgi:hypothetical protein